jgi:hypothetical protein
MSDNEIEIIINENEPQPPTEIKYMGMIFRRTQGDHVFEIRRKGWQSYFETEYDSISPNDTQNLLKVIKILGKLDEVIDALRTNSGRVKLIENFPIYTLEDHDMIKKYSKKYKMLNIYRKSIFLWRYSVINMNIDKKSQIYSYEVECHGNHKKVTIRMLKIEDNKIVRKETNKFDTAKGDRRMLELIELI